MSASFMFLYSTARTNGRLYAWNYSSPEESSGESAVFSLLFLFYGWFGHLFLTFGSFWWAGLVYQSPTGVQQVAIRPKFSFHIHGRITICWTDRQDGQETCRLTGLFLCLIAFISWRKTRKDSDETKKIPVRHVLSCPLTGCKHKNNSFGEVAVTDKEK